MTVRRTMDAAYLNSIANHPDVRPYIGGEGPIDLTAILANPANYGLVTEGGGWLLQAVLPGAYELHTLVAPEGRGKPFFAAAREALRWMFTRTECLEILTKVPDDNPGARMAATLVGFRERFHRADAWAPGVGISYQALTLDEWWIRDRECLREGRLFHETLEAAKTAAGSTLPQHPEDEAHDRAVGAAALMILGGQVGKAIGHYNRWAVFAGYAPITQVGPCTFDVVDAVIEVAGGEMAVLLVRGAEPHE